MRAYLALLVGLVPVAGAFSAEEPANSSMPSKPVPGVFVVATNGSDSWSGHLPAPNSGKTDGPFTTLARALKAAREFSSGARTDPAQHPTIWLRGGTYFVNAPVVLTPEDSRLVLSAAPNERPVLSGGRPISGWKPVTVGGRNLWAAEIPQVKAGHWYFRELWINGTRAVRARHPNHGYLGVAELPDKAPQWTEGQARFRYREGDLKPGPTLTNAEVVVMSRWVESRLPIKDLDTSQRLLTFRKRAVFELAADDPYYIEGALELLDEPGEWYLDGTSGRLYYQPRPGETIDRSEAVAPALTQVLRVEGKPEAGRFIEGVTLRGLTFSHTEWYFAEGFSTGPNKPVIDPEPKPEVGGFGQAAIGVPGAVWGEGVHNCSFTNCTFSHLGDYGLELARGCQGNHIAACEFADLGAGGIKLGETAIRASANEQSGDNEVTRCRVHDGGKMFHSAIGIWLGQSGGNRLLHNLIHDFYYTGISIGWTWGYGPALAGGNRVEFNHVHHIGVKSDGDGPILSDMGGIYTLGKQPGTTVLNNLWHDIAGLRYGGWGIYFDEGSSGIVAESNVVYRTTHGGFHQHYGETNILRNNIFAFARDHQLQRTRVEPHQSFAFETNIVYFDSGVLLGGDWSGDQYQMDRNLYFDTRTGTNSESFHLGAGTWAKWHERSHDRNSVLADPLFTSVQDHDFTLRADSPALKLGFHPIDLTHVGP
jgi:hypothetical protein